jgi:anti-sigma factor RsiW
VPEENLTPEEIARLRAMLQQDERVAWLYASMRQIAAWVFGVAAALVAFRADIGNLFSWLFTRGGQ